MNELVLANRAADWRRLKMLVLDSSRHRSRKDLQSRAGRVFRVVRAGAPIRVQQGDGQHVEGRPRGPRAGLDFDEGGSYFISRTPRFFQLTGHFFDRRVGRGHPPLQSNIMSFSVQFFK